MSDKYVDIVDDDRPQLSPDSSAHIKAISIMALIGVIITTVAIYLLVMDNLWGAMCIAFGMGFIIASLGKIIEWKYNYKFPC